MQLVHSLLGISHSKSVTGEGEAHETSIPNQDKILGAVTKTHPWSGTIPIDTEDLHQLPSTRMSNDKLSSYTSSLRMGRVTSKLSSYANSYRPRSSSKIEANVSWEVRGIWDDRMVNNLSRGVDDPK